MESVHMMSRMERPWAGALERAQRPSQAEEMKNVRRAGLRRRVMENPALARKLPAIQASPLYTAGGDLIAAVAAAEDLKV